MSLPRRVFLAGLPALVALFVWGNPLGGLAWGNPGPHAHPHRRRRRRSRRVRRHRMRHRARWRTVGGRRRLIVPLATVAGVELLLHHHGDDHVVVVREVHKHTVVVEYPDGDMEEIQVVKEDTPENREELKGSEYEVEVSDE